ncbi:aldehyde dehydrogenase family protein [Actinosynnema sp. NPDC050436]|uniref:aldehyde dehydrogenase family protein n=1 Tax=Actinosynnema sp. NPDC050436 TaxID=3155659 RepID=UPI0033E13D7E
MTRYAAPGRPGSVVSYRERYDHFIGGDHVPPARGRYLADASPVTGEVFTEVARGTAEDVDHALDAAHGAARGWGRTSPAERATVLTEVADRVEDHLEALAVAETWENGKPVGEALAADLPLAVDRFRYFAGAVRAQEGGVSQVGRDLVAYRFPEPLGVVGQLASWQFPLLSAVWELAPALAAGNAVVLRPAVQTPASVHVLVGLIADLLPPGVVNVVTGLREEVGRALASSRRVGRIAFGGEASTGRLAARCASENLVPVAVEPGGQGPDVYFADVVARRDAFYHRALAGFTAFALDQGQVCPSRVLVQGPAHDEFLADAAERTRALRRGDPLDTRTEVGAQVTAGHRDRLLAQARACRDEGARLVCGGEPLDLGGGLSGGFYAAPTVLEGDHKARACLDGVAGPLVVVSRFDDFDDVVKAADDIACGPGAGVWSRDGGTAYRAAREIQAGRVWVNDHFRYPAHAAFGGGSGLGGEDHRAALDAYQQTKNLVVRY